jgi:hypothetical protein
MTSLNQLAQMTLTALAMGTDRFIARQPVRPLFISERNLRIVCDAPSLKWAGHRAATARSSPRRLLLIARILVAEMVPMKHRRWHVRLSGH